ncbi:MAG TPA: hypothetical protein VNZ68_04405 [Rhodocyclaceae bacterium]|nr:hypothetical protein [Rhodocyclaceae bacterium]
MSAQAPDSMLPLLQAIQSCVNQGQAAEAIRLWEEAGRPENRETLFLTAIAVQQLDDLALARAKLEKALALDPDYPPAQLRLAQVALSALDYPATIAWADRYLNYRPYSQEAISWKVFAMQKNGQAEAAEQALMEYIRVFPYSLATAQCSIVIANERKAYVYALLMGGRLPLEHWHRSYAGQTLAACCFHLSHAPLMHAVVDIVYADTVAEEDAEYAALIGNLATLGDAYEDAVQWYTRARQLDPHAETSWFNEAISRWATGDFAAGSIAYRERGKLMKLMRLDGIPEWRGENLEGKTLLVHSEQGSGDVIQFIRYMPYLREIAGTVLFNTYPDILALLRTDEKSTAAQGLNESLLDKIDYQIWMMDVPGYLRPNGLADFPADTPYLFPPQERVASWKNRLAPYQGLKVGLVWAGNPEHANDPNRSASLAEWSALSELQGVHWFSLQKGHGEPEASYPPPGLTLNNLSPEIRDFSDTAAILANLDLLISVDTSVAHLAGACGRPCWTLLPKQCIDWRWANQPEIPHYYPSMRLIRRQKEDIGWDSLVRREVIPRLIELGATTRPTPSETSLSAYAQTLAQARTTLQNGKLSEALTLSVQGLTEYPGDPRLQMVCADAHIRMGNKVSAGECAAEVLRIFPRSVNAHRIAMQSAKKDNLLGMSTHLQAMLRIEPDNHAIWQDAARFYMTHHAPLIAYLVMRHLVSLNPSHSHITTLAISLLRLGNRDAAASLLADIEPASGDSLELLQELYYACATLNQRDKADLLQSAITARGPIGSDLGLMIGSMLLRWGEQEGWKFYNLCNWPDPVETPLNVPIWNGEALDGKHLLIYQDQGYGDVIQFFPLINRLPSARKITLSVFSEVRDLLSEQSLPRGLEIITHKKLSEDSAHYDYRIGFMHWVAGLAPDLTRLPAPYPYLRVSSSPRLETWEQKMMVDAGFKVGIAWAGNPAHFNDYNRSTQLGDWLPLTQISGISLYNLQRDHASDQVFEYPQFEFQNIVADCKTLRDTAAAMRMLDLVVIVDTGPAHLAASLGVETWILLPNLGNDFRWMQERDDCPWYPSVRLFRQDINEPWSSVLQRVATALHERMAHPANVVAC